MFQFRDCSLNTRPISHCADRLAVLFVLFATTIAHVSNGTIAVMPAKAWERWALYVNLWNREPTFRDVDVCLSPARRENNAVTPFNLDCTHCSG